MSPGLDIFEFCRKNISEEQPFWHISSEHFICKFLAVKWATSEATVQNEYSSMKLGHEEAVTIPVSSKSLRMKSLYVSDKNSIVSSPSLSSRVYPPELMTFWICSQEAVWDNSSIIKIRLQFVSTLLILTIVRSTTNSNFPLFLRIEFHIVHKFRQYV